MSGGVDSTVTAVLLHKAIGQQLHGIFVDNGLLREDEFPTVLSTHMVWAWMCRGIDASARFLTP